MTESFRRSGEYPQGDQQSPYTQSDAQQDPYAQGDAQQSAYPEQSYASSAHPVSSSSTPFPNSPSTSSVNPEWPPPPAYEPAQQGAAPTALLTEPVSPAPGSPGSPATRRKRAKGPLALLAAVAIAAAAVGGGTAYAFQELTGNDTVATSSTSTSVVPTSEKGTVAGVAKAVSPSIVEISATSNAGQSTGSGVIITSGGEIITNNHVISGASEIKVQLSNGKSYTAKVVGTDSKKDLALIKLENAPSGLTVATLGDSTGVKVGDQVVAIGSPEGLTGTVTSGIVSALDRDVTVSTGESQGQQQQQQGGGSGQWPFEFGGQEFNGDTGSSTTTYKALQTDASLNPGNSGGALIDMNGNIIGINSAMYSAADATSSTAGSVGLGFAIPINTVKSDLATLRAGGSDS
ncbi:trypsin-like peptidase domain-containing protein [Streptomyces sp. NBC_00878]|uniref:trypsin-like peptidase domain-containing protein n=1 Tax=Streptomyces sp. NBC_00878 TaxID=2975854 RepID=UPI00224D1C61|nr:trypsin-like peptidase domain-containing protein [Streptomyces sp. NBC_00878]MCX4906740.1 trypsin-like peptidase domain-containing protein [Streptomyces sp. NBC_00878]